MIPTAEEKFEKWLDRLGPLTGGFRDAIVEVVDTAKGCELWLARLGKVDPSDVVGLTKLVMDHHHWLREQEEVVLVR